MAAQSATQSYMLKETMNSHGEASRGGTTPPQKTYEDVKAVAVECAQSKVAGATSRRIE